MAEWVVCALGYESQSWVCRVPFSTKAIGRDTATVILGKTIPMPLAPGSGLRGRCFPRP